MSSAIGPMTFDELSELYRVEMKSASLTTVRRDLFRALANLLTSLRQEYDRQMSLDPDSVMTEGADQRRKKAERLCKDVIILRTRKISGMAIRGAEGGRNTLDALTDEERAYYDTILALTERQFSEIDRLRGRRTTRETHIDEPPARDAPAPEPVAEPESVHEVVPEPTVEAPAPAAPAPEEQFPEEMGMPDEAFDEPFDDMPDEFPPEEAVATPAPAAVPEAVPEPAPVAIPEAPAPAEEPVEEDTGSDLTPVLIRILEDLPEFAGPDRDYRLSKEDVVTLPKVLADVLVNTEKAVNVRPTP
ncbi:MAG: hypothetical protein Q4Q58_03690 [Thermoplasmata archaeon]|nr:hypothetical protein [Thermoplasmata archaeon]